MKTGTSRILKNSFWAVLAVVLLYFSFKGVDWKDFWTVLTECRWSLVVLAMMAGVLAFIIRSMRWRLLLLPEDPDTKLVDCYDGFTVGRLCDFVIPHVGEFVRCGYVLSPRLTYDKVLGTVVLERVWDIFMLLVITVLLLVFKWEGFPNVLCEAMSCGLPVLASDVSDVRHIMEDGVNGFLMNPTSPDDMAKTIIRY